MGSVPHATHQDKFLMAQRFKCKTVKPNTRKKICVNSSLTWKYMLNPKVQNSEAIKKNSMHFTTYKIKNHKPKEKIRENKQENSHCTFFGALSFRFGMHIRHLNFVLL